TLFVCSDVLTIAKARGYRGCHALATFFFERLDRLADRPANCIGSSQQEGCSMWPLSEQGSHREGVHRLGDGRLVFHFRCVFRPFFEQRIRPIDTPFEMSNDSKFHQRETKPLSVLELGVLIKTRLEQSRGSFVVPRATRNDTEVAQRARHQVLDSQFL